MALVISMSLSEAELQWRAFLESLVKQELHSMQLITSDNHVGIDATQKALKNNFVTIL